MDLVSAPLLVPVIVLISAFIWVLLSGEWASLWIVLATLGIVVSLIVLLFHDLRRLRRGPRDSGTRSKQV